MVVEKRDGEIAIELLGTTSGNDIGNPLVSGQSDIS